MEGSRGQGELFPIKTLPIGKVRNSSIKLSSEILKDWQKRIQNYQEYFFREFEENLKQESLLSNTFHSTDTTFIESAKRLNPLGLTPLPITFWRSNTNRHEGPAIYLVLDSPKEFKTPILLYIGETIAAEKRWKGDHDCKNYLAAYTEALSHAKIEFKLSIRFWTDVPGATKARRKVEQLLIQKWHPPFNKETRYRWSTPFTAETN